MSKAPTATVTTTGGDKVITFNAARLMAIENAFDRSATELFLGELVVLFPRDYADGRATPAEVLRIVKTSRVKIMAPFVAACLDTTVEKLEDLVGLDRLLQVFSSLVIGFAESVQALTGGGEEAGKEADGPPALSAGAGPGPASSSASGSPNSTG